MRKHILAITGAAVLTLSGQAIAADEWRPVTYTCESGITLEVQFRASGGAARVKASDRKQVRLIGRPSKEGERYADSRHELRVNGDQATWRVGDRPAVTCTPTPAAGA